MAGVEEEEEGVNGVTSVDKPDIRESSDATVSVFAPSSPINTGEELRREEEVLAGKVWIVLRSDHLR